MRSLTSRGVAAAGLTFALTLAALLSGNNLLYLPLGALLVLWGTEPWLGRRNLAGLRVSRDLPVELVAGREATGALLVESPLGSFAITLEEVGWPGATTRADRLPSGRCTRVPLRWQAARRGAVHLEAVVARSSWPYGWVERQISLALPGTVRVWPAPRAGSRERAEGIRPTEAQSRAQRSFDGDFEGFREALPGEDPRAIHWPTSARLGREIAVLRGQAGEAPLWVEVPERRGVAWEDGLSAAAGEIQRGLARGAPVGLRTPQETFPPGSGEVWRRTLLDHLADLPERP